jgi:hypothetical protein
LRLAADPKAGLVHMFDRRRFDSIEQSTDEISKPVGANLVHPGDGGRH